MWSTSLWHYIGYRCNNTLDDRNWSVLLRDHCYAEAKACQETSTCFLHDQLGSVTQCGSMASFNKFSRYYYFVLFCVMTGLVIANIGACSEPFIDSFQDHKKWVWVQGVGTSEYNNGQARHAFFLCREVVYIECVFTYTKRGPASFGVSFSYHGFTHVGWFT